jgi:Serine-pyruvate aminotransferase/archaeal aspartate aminotransferase
MPGLLPDIDPDGLLEFSVVYTDRALNHMSKRFVGVAQDILGVLKEVYHAHTAVLVPGSGTFGMEAVARQFANGQKVLIVRNGWFSYRWTQIFEVGNFGWAAVRWSARRANRGPAARIRGRRAPRKTWPPLSVPKSPRWCLPRTWKPPAASCCPMTTSARLPMPRTKWAP